MVLVHVETTGSKKAYFFYAMAFKFVLIVVETEIVSRDINWFQHLCNGSCPCEDCW